MKKLLILALLLFIPFALTGCYESEGNDRVAACTYAEMEVKTKLKSPSTAEFPACTYQDITEISANKYKVKSYVDAQNGFGGTVRSDYSCTVTLTGGDEYYISCSVY